MFEKLGVRNNLLKLVKSNFSLYRIVLICIVICYEFECISNKIIMQNPNIKLITAMKDIVVLLILPLIISLVILLVIYLKDKIENKKLGEEYYRDILDKISCVELTYLDDNNVEFEKDIVATLLELNLKKKIKFENNKIIVVDKNKNNLTEHEKYVLKVLLQETNKNIRDNYSIWQKTKNIFSNFISVKSIDEFEMAIFYDLKKSKIIEDNSVEKLERKYRKLKKIFIIIFGLILIFLGSGEAEIASYFLFVLLYVFFGWCLIKIPLPQMRRSVLSRIIFYCIIPWVGLYSVTLIASGLLLIPIIVEEYQQEVLVILKYLFMVITIVSIFIESYIILKNKKKLTMKGKDIKIKLCGLKTYLNDFSTMRHKDLNEIELWDEYIIYSVILNENKKITRKITQILKNTIGNN